MTPYIFFLHAYHGDTFTNQKLSKIFIIDSDFHFLLQSKNLMHGLLPTP